MRAVLARAAAVAALVLLAEACGSPAEPGRGPTTAIPPAASTTASPPTTVTAPATSTTSARPSTTITSSSPPPTSSSTTPPRPGPAVVVTRGPSDRAVVALTFDAGSDPGRTGQILATLAANHAAATFGITGSWAQANPDLVRRIAAAGHQIVNHTWDHRSFTGASTGASPLTAAQIGSELATTDDLIRRLTGSGTSGWFRPPYGDRNPTTDTAAGSAGYHYELMWTVDTLGWKGVSPDTVVQRALASAGPGEIILMHVGSASTDADALPALIAGLRSRGLDFATASALVR